MTGYQELRESAALIDAGGRGKIFARGEDRVRLLHAMTTNHVEQLKPGEALYAFFLSAQGRVLADVNLFSLEDYLLLDTEPETARKVYEHLDKFIIADDVTLEDATPSMATLSVEGPSAVETLQAKGFNVTRGIADSGGVLVARTTLTGADGAMLFVPSDRKAEVIANLALPVADDAAVNTVRLENARPTYGIDFSDANIPQETGIQRALNFSKGCYIGQEIVERVRSRGHVNKLLTPLTIEGAAERGTKIVSNGKEVGEVTSAAWSPALNVTVAFAIVRAEALAIELTTAAGARVKTAKPGLDTSVKTAR